MLVAVLTFMALLFWPFIVFKTWPFLCPVLGESYSAVSVISFDGKVKLFNGRDG